MMIFEHYSGLRVLVNVTEHTEERETHDGRVLRVVFKRSMRTEAGQEVIGVTKWDGDKALEIDVAVGARIVTLRRVE